MWWRRDGDAPVAFGAARGAVGFEPREEGNGDGVWGRWKGGGDAFRALLIWARA